LHKTLLAFFLTGVVIISITFAVKANVDDSTYLTQKIEDCPRESDLLQTSNDDREELTRALGTLIPETYIKGDENGDYYNEWSIITVTPLPMTIGSHTEDIYYEIAKNFCQKEVANKSWLIQLHFPKWDGVSTSNNEGEIFVAKSKEKGWYVWYRYH